MQIFRLEFFTVGFTMFLELPWLFVTLGIICTVDYNEARHCNGYCVRLVNKR